MAVNFANLGQTFLITEIELAPYHHSLSSIEEEFRSW